MRMPNTVARHYREVADRYARETGHPEYELADVVQWAMGLGGLQMSPAEVQEFHVNRLSEALRSDVTRDGQGRSVRVRHCVQVCEELPGEKPRQRCLWAHLDDARDEFLVQSLRQRRDRIRVDVDALRADLDFINDRRALRGLRPIQLDFSFPPRANGEEE